MYVTRKSPKVSILVPVCNVDKFLEKCLDSLCHQTLDDIEIICLDDGSTDYSPQIISSFAKKDNRIKVITKTNSGYGDTLNKGLSLAQGEYVGIVESDDFVKPCMFENLYHIAKLHDVDIVKSRFLYYWDNQDPVISQKMVNIPYDTLIIPKDYPEVFTIAAIWSAIYKRSFLQKTGIRFLTTPGASYQDSSFGFKVLAKASNIYFTSDAYLYYRQDNMYASTKATSWDKIMYSIGEIEEIGRFLDIDINLKSKLMVIYNTLKLKVALSNIERSQPRDRGKLFLYIQPMIKDVYVSKKYYNYLFRTIEKIQLFFIANNCYFGIDKIFFLKRIKQYF